MAHYLLEVYARRGDGHVARRLATAASRNGVQCLGTILIPDDEICFCLVEALSAPAVAELAEILGLEAERIVEAVVDDGTLRA